MPNTLIPIQTVTVGSGGSSSITFTNIPQSYTDLVIRTSLRTSGTVTAGIARCRMQINSSTSGYSNHLLFSLGSAAASSGTGTDYITFFYANDDTATAGAFSNSSIYITNYTGSTNKSVSVDSVAESNSTSQGILAFNSGTLSSTAAVTSLTITQADGFTLVQNSTATLYGVSNGVKATGGTLTVAGGYAYHTFTSTGSFLPNERIKGAEVLAVAGGGGGGSRMGGGGGAGGVLYASTQTFNAGTLYTALVGAGGAGGAASNSSSFPGAQGGNSQISSLTAVGGGFGALGNSGSATAGGNGGSGGGAGTNNSSSFSGGTATIGQGNAGGSSFAEAYSPSGGGGGAGAAGGNATATAGGNGGAGSSSYTAWHSITNTGVLSGGLYYIAGGGGGVRFATAATTGGIGGGGAGATQNPSNPFNGTAGVAGTANTGGGGGGGGQSGVDTSPQYQALAGGAGGSGLIIVRYPLS